MEGNVILASKDNAVTNASAEEKVFFSLREVENFSKVINGGGRLFHKNLNRGVGDNGFTIVRAEEVFNVLGDGGEAEVIFSGAFGHGVDKGSGVRIFHQIPGLVNNQEAPFKVFFNASPDKVKDHEHGNRAKGVFKLFDGKDGKGVGDVNIGVLIKDAAEGAFDKLF